MPCRRAAGPQPQDLVRWDSSGLFGRAVGRATHESSAIRTRVGRPYVLEDPDGEAIGGEVLGQALELGPVAGAGPRLIALGGTQWPSQGTSLQVEATRCSQALVVGHRDRSHARWPERRDRHPGFSPTESGLGPRWRPEYRQGCHQGPYDDLRRQRHRLMSRPCPRARLGGTTPRGTAVVPALYSFRRSLGRRLRRTSGGGRTDRVEMGSRRQRHRTPARQSGDPRHCAGDGRRLGPGSVPRQQPRCPARACDGLSDRRRGGPGPRRAGAGRCRRAPT